MLLYKRRMGRSVYAYPHLLRHTHTHTKFKDKKQLVHSSQHCCCQSKCRHFSIFTHFWNHEGVTGDKDQRRINMEILSWATLKDCCRSITPQITSWRKRNLIFGHTVVTLLLLGHENKHRDVATSVSSDCTAIYCCRLETTAARRVSASTYSIQRNPKGNFSFSRNVRNKTGFREQLGHDWPQIRKQGIVGVVLVTGKAKRRHLVFLY